MNLKNQQALAETNLKFYNHLWSMASFCRPERFNTWQLLSDLASVSPTRLEIGPGYRPRLPIQGTHFLDVSDVAISKLEELGGKGHCCSIEDFSIADQSFDLVAAFDVIELLEDHESIFKLIGQLIKPGGHFCFSVPLHPDAWSDFDVIVGHSRRYDIPLLDELLQKNGFVVEASAGFGMKPKSRFLTDVGMWWLKKNPKKAMYCYNNFFFPFALRRQETLVLQQGLGSFETREGIVVHATKSI